MSRGQDTRTRILDAAQDSVLAKGFDGTSIDEIVAAVGITKSGFFYHFRDKNALACALIDRHVEVEGELFENLFQRANELTDDPLQRALISLKLLAELIEDMPTGHPGCIVATAAYQDRLFDRSVREANLRAVMDWRGRFLRLFEEITETYPLRDDIDIVHLADMVNSVLEGGIVISRALGEPQITAQQVMMLRSYIKLLFQPTVQ